MELTGFPTDIDSSHFVNLRITKSHDEWFPANGGYYLCKYVLLNQGNKMRLEFVDLEKLPKTIQSSAALNRYVKEHLHSKALYDLGSPELERF